MAQGGEAGWPKSLKEEDEPVRREKLRKSAAKQMKMLSRVTLCALGGEG
jgi:hypothetical protein